MIVEEKRVLAPLTTFKIGGPATFFAQVKNFTDLEEVQKLGKAQGLPLFVLGGGSNVLIRDGGFQGIVLKPDFDFIEVYDNEVHVGAGTIIAHVVFQTVSLGLMGLEWAGGLPGTVGGAIRGNAGCFGGEIKDSVLSVEACDMQTGQFKNFTPEECNFSYRMSFFKKNPQWLVVQAKLRATKGNKDELMENMQSHIAFRKEHHPLEYPNAGSTFKNVPLASVSEKVKQLAQEQGVVKTDPFPVIPSAFLIDQCNLKDKEIGGAAVSVKHPNFMINKNHATAQDILDLIAYVKDTVHKKFEVILEEEIFIL
ncbi:MAG: UDP-N-acetylenolpyruvoylglucosamine reductase [Parcubacteria group bacterium GW2011_GWC1_41_7]|nr:MAG: UDP-N-acetylenolpyruvoylglucosamine reductase [Parcubacteria group bacterium GW2011_GWC1_41_7]